MYNRKNIALILILLVFFLVLLQYVKKIREDYIPTKYEKELIDYFKEIALQSEYSDNPDKVIKWKEPMILFVVKEREFNRQMSTIRKTIDEINRLATDGFKIVLTNNLSESNSILYLCSKEKVAELNSEFYKVLTDGVDNEITGFAYSEFSTKNHIIDISLIFINSEYPVEIQESTILEEITQSLGLGFDSNAYPNSVFYQKKYEQEITIKEYSKLDRDVIRLLYNPKMKSSFNSNEAEKVIKRILKSEKN